MFVPRRVERCLVMVLVFTMQSLKAAQGPDTPNEVAEQIVKEGLGLGKAHAMLTELCTTVGGRLSGSQGAEKGVAWAMRTMEACGLERVRLEPVLVPHWERGPAEQLSILDRDGRSPISLRICALGGSVGTPQEGITAEVLMVKSFDELRGAGEKARGRIIFLNRPFDPSLFDPFQAYLGAGDQRVNGPSEAARAGGVVALVRSMTSRIDDAPHTGMTLYANGVPQLPAAAISTLGADRLAAELARDPELKLQIKMGCRTLPDVPSHNVIGELVGRELPGEVVVIGGHLDSWDLGQGAHDDGAGCVHAIEALRILKKIGLRPKRTIRAVMFMNEENGTRGAIAYAAEKRPGETHVAAIESDNGGFVPRGFAVEANTAAFEAISRLAPALAPIEAERIKRGGAGGDIYTLMEKGVPGLSLMVNPQRYFQFHHTENDRIEAVDERELELGAIAMAIMSYQIAEEGLPAPAPAK